MLLEHVFLDRTSWLSVTHYCSQKEETEDMLDVNLMAGSHPFR